MSSLDISGFNILTYPIAGEREKDKEVSSKKGRDRREKKISSML